MATKVVFFNELYQLCKKADIDYDIIRLLVQEDERIGTSHMNVPGEHGLGYGGSCFPKDVEAFISMARNMGSELNILETAEKVNKELAKQHII